MGTKSYTKKYKIGKVIYHVVSHYSDSSELYNHIGNLIKSDFEKDFYQDITKELSKNDWLSNNDDSILLSSHTVSGKEK